MDRRQSEVCDSDRRFDSVMEKVGFQGPYQTRFNIIFNFVLVIFASMSYLNIILGLAVPDHWCHVPGRENTNFTIEEWKNITLPKKLDTRGRFSNSECEMYNISSNDSFMDPEKSHELDVITCQFGWDFDQTYYDETAPSEAEWVCDKELYVSNAFAFGRIGDVAGTFIFGQLGDIIGRKPVFFITLIILTVGRCLSAFSIHNYKLFFFSTFLGSFASTAVFQAPLIISMEITEEKRRAHVQMLQCVGWTGAMCLMPFIFWAMRHWFTYTLATTLPCILFLFSSRFIVESPRWLASRGKTVKCIKELEHIAKVNGTKVPEDAIILLRPKSGKVERILGVMSLFSSWRLARNTILIMYCWINISLVYNVLVLSVNELGGNPFLNFFWQGVAELPSYILGEYFSNRIGRRWTQVLPFLISALSCVPLALSVTDPEMEYLTSLLAAFIKFAVSLAWYATCLHTIELYPTALRQSGLAVGQISSSAIGILAPYVVYLGSAFDAKLPFFIIGLVALVGTITASFLPETLHEKLPETMADAKLFGKTQKYWSIPRKEESEPLNKM